MNTTPSAIQSFFVQSGQQSCAVVSGIQAVADCLHDFLCSCHGIRWIDCTKPKLKAEIQRLFNSEHWVFAAGQPFRFDTDFGHTFSRVVQLTPSQIPAITSLRFSVPLLPPSVNHYKQPNQRGGWHVTAEAKAFIDAVAIFARPAAPADWLWNIGHSTLSSPRLFYEIDLIFHINQALYLKVDSDNLEKVAFDALVKCGAITDDRYIKYHTNRALPVSTVADERTEYSVRIVEEPK